MCRTAFLVQREYSFADGLDSRLIGHGKVDASQKFGKMFLWGFTISFQTGAKYLKTGEQ